MPSYDYRCSDCKSHFTVERSMSDNTQPNCASCGSENANRVWTVVATLTGGSTTDYGQGTFGSTSTSTTKSGCGSCVSKNCGTCC